MVREKLLVPATWDVPNTCYYCYNVVEAVNSPSGSGGNSMWNPQLVLILLRFNHHRHKQKGK